MNPALLFPAGLAALAAVILPLLIHLARRTETRPTDFAALRWLRQKPRPRHRPRLEEWPLLAARCLLLLLLALWLARPVLLDSADRSPRVAIVPGVDLAVARAAIGEDARGLWLVPGFPGVGSLAPTGPTPFASLLRQLDSELPAGVKLTVLVPRQLQGADAERPRLSRAVEWRVLPGAMPGPAPAIAPIPPLTVRYASSRSDGLRYLRAAALAWQPPSKSANFQAAATTQPLRGAARNLVWLSPDPPPPAVIDWAKGGGTLLLDAATKFELPASATVLWRDAVGQALAEGAALEQGRILRFTRPLSPSAMPQLLEPDFPLQLRAILSPPPRPPARVAARGHAPLAGAAAYPQPPRDLRPWLAVLIAGLLLVERWLATRRRRRVAP